MAKDPTIKSQRAADASSVPQGDHVAPIGTYEDNPDKPHETSVAQIEVVTDPLFATDEAEQRETR
jgi:hypothetical protein